MALFAIAIPIAPGKMAHFENFIEQLNGDKKAEFLASRKKLGVRERTFHQHTPMGEIVIVTLEGDNPAAAFAKFGEGTDAFSTWFRSEVKNIHGVDLAAPPPGPMPHILLDTEG
ncbi:hypothetical protein C3941_11670 [Kaistia algarum]|uniref:hypothetical protein n=1 Tax=Kaistia algarum TaxID=2083279 RepID=UPI000CE8A95C|nr:hypothetical protein [Kaistia algarum]MCX5515004.1 hypothetical protein [Kaistia algarum]PPE79746.1 hypothetical protein C3941_11670 [Kaistia algarum]